MDLGHSAAANNYCVVHSARQSRFMIEEG
jgi:hypothetical protein